MGPRERRLRARALVLSGVASALLVLAYVVDSSGVSIALNLVALVALVAGIVAFLRTAAASEADHREGG